MGKVYEGVDTVRDGVRGLSIQVRNGFTDIKERLLNCWDVRYFQRHVIYCLSLILKFILMGILQVHNYYAVFMHSVGSAAGDAASGIPYVGPVISYIVKLGFISLFLAGFCIFYGIIFGAIFWTNLGSNCLFWNAYRGIELCTNIYHGIHSVVMRKYRRN